MANKNYNTKQKELYKKRVKETLTNDIYVRKLEGIRISQMIWAAYFINTNLIEIGRLQYEKRKNHIKIHIPAGDRLEIEKVLESIKDSENEIEKYFNLKNIEYSVCTTNTHAIFLSKNRADHESALRLNTAN